MLYSQNRTIRHGPVDHPQEMAVATYYVFEESSDRVTSRNPTPVIHP